MRLGVLGGTFDPIHLGHLLLAEQAREQLDCSKVLLIPAARPPHKPDRVITPYSLRLRMVRLAVESFPELSASSLEEDAARPSYTADTLRRLWAGTAGLERIWLIMGSDSLSELASWREPEEILRLATLAVYPRPREERHGDEELLAPAVDRDLPILGPDQIQRLDGPRLRLSSSEIRRRVAEKRSIRFLVHETVRSFILEHGLYLAPAGCGDDPPAPGLTDG